MASVSFLLNGLFIGSSVLASIYLGYLYEQWWPLVPKGIPYITVSELRDSYDFIVIGAGNSGSVVATRLALDDSHPSVLLIEAGNKAEVGRWSVQTVPAYTQRIQNTSADWHYKTVPQETCCSFANNRRSQWPRGKGMGGSSMHNYMMWVRGHPDDWNKIFNVDGWSWDDVLPYFQKVETFIPFHEDVEDINWAVRSRAGPIYVQDARSYNNHTRLKHRFIEAAVELGYPQTVDYNDGYNAKGFGFTQSNVGKTGHRESAFVGYVKHLMASNAFKENEIELDILPLAHATKIHFNSQKSAKSAKKATKSVSCDAENDAECEKIDGNGNELLTATGVSFVDLSTGETHRAFVKNPATKGEVIVSGGAINSPQILMLSGIGPSEELEKHGIEVLCDLPGVGKRLQDHPLFLVTFNTSDEYRADVTTKDLLNEFSTKYQFAVHKTGPLTDATGNAVGFITTNWTQEKYGDGKEEVLWNDFEFEFLSSYAQNPGYFNQREGVLEENECGSKENLEKIPTGNLEAFQVMGTLLHPTSMGTVTLKSADAMDAPLIDPKYLSTEYDMRVYMAGYKALRRIMDVPVMRQTWNEHMKCMKNGDIDTNDTALEMWLRDGLLTNYHPTSTCAMGNDEDETAVLDNKLMVRGTRNVRVIDASSLPGLTSGNTQAPCFMIGEKGAALVLKEWNLAK